MFGSLCFCWRSRPHTTLTSTRCESRIKPTTELSDSARSPTRTMARHVERRACDAGSTHRATVRRLTVSKKCACVPRRLVLPSLLHTFAKHWLLLVTPSIGSLNSLENRSNELATIFEPTPL